VVVVVVVVDEPSSFLQEMLNEAMATAANVIGMNILFITPYFIG